ncbi:hypothetical protein L0337_05640 [candidate division KSB1 bacterium]|nr:hypothetical protein [candidate division KSB1 bacterium]
MNVQNSKTENKNHRLSSAQAKTFKKFQRKLNEKVPDYRIAWVRPYPYKESILEIGLESQKKIGYRKGLQAAKVATEVEDETGVTIILF